MGAGGGEDDEEKKRRKARREGRIQRLKMKLDRGAVMSVQSRAKGLETYLWHPAS
jgi:hypothetical protein